MHKTWFGGSLTSACDNIEIFTETILFLHVIYFQFLFIYSYAQKANFWRISWFDNISHYQTHKNGGVDLSVVH